MLFCISKKLRVCAFLSLMIIGSLLQAQPCRGQQNLEWEMSGADNAIEFNFQNVDIHVLIKFISQLTGKNFVIDDRVKGEVSIMSPSRISPDEAYEVFKSVLEVHGYTTVDAGNIIKVIPAPDARTKSIKTLLEEESSIAEAQIVTQLIPLRYADAGEIRQLFTPLISKNSVILAYPQTNTLIVTDVYSNIQRLVRIIRAIDVAGIGKEISVIPLEFANAADMENLLQTVFSSRTQAAKTDIEDSLRFVSDERTNTIVLVASEDDTVRIKHLISLLDKETPRSKSKIHVYYLENATAEDLATVLQDLSLEKSNSRYADGTQATMVSENVRITADKSTNSLIIVADNDEYTVLEEIISKLDIPRSMVYIESLIMEVNVDKTFDLGVDWSVLGKTTIDGKDSIIGGGFSGTGGIDPKDLVMSQGFTMGVVGGGIEIATELGSVIFPSIGAIARAYRQDKDVHILSTPQILTTDNKEARITVGRNIPFQTQATISENQVFNSFEYRDVGIMLTITPHISRDRLVRIKILQEVTSIPENRNNPADRPTTLKRSIETTVIVKDRNTVVIGGLIDDTFSTSENSVPCLGNVPGLSWLFKNRSQNNQKTNLFVFLTPHVIQTSDEVADLYNQKRTQMNEIEEGNIKMYKKIER